MTKIGDQLAPAAFGALVVVTIVAGAFGIGYLIGKLLL